jgi:hypothetical protein
VKDDITLDFEATHGITKQQSAYQRIGPLFDSYVSQVDGNGTEDADTNMSDFLADVMHFCAASGIDFDDALGRGQVHYGFESEDPEDDPQDQAPPSPTLRVVE